MYTTINNNVHNENIILAFKPKQPENTKSKHHSGSHIPCATNLPHNGKNSKTQPKNLKQKRKKNFFLLAGGKKT